MTGSRSLDRWCSLQIVESAVAIRHQHRDRSSGRPPQTDPTEVLGDVRLDSLSTTTPVSTLSATEFAVDEVGVDLHATGQPLEERDDARPV